MGTFVPATDVTGWSTYTGPPPASVYYIASLANGGSDSNDGLAGTVGGGHGPFLTLTKGLNTLNALSAGTEAWLLLREGDTWDGEEFGNITLSGPGTANPVVISSYHTSVPNTFHPAIAARPLLRPTANQVTLRFRGNNLAVIGLDIYCISRDPNGGFFVDGNQGASAFYSLENNSSIRLEDVQIRFCGSGLSFSGGTVDGVTLHRCCISDNYAYSQAAQGLLVQWINSTISECVWDHNGWNASVPTSYVDATRNRNIYIASYTAPWARQPVSPSGPCTIKNSIITNDGSGTQPRAGGPLTNNLFARNPYAVNYGMPIAGSNDVSRNVILNGVLDPNGGATYGGFATFGPSQGDDSTLGSINFHDNIIAHTINAVQNGVVLDKGVNGCTVDQNIFYQWNCSGAKIDSQTGSLKTVGSLGSITAGSGYTRGALFTGHYAGGDKTLIVTAVASGGIYIGQCVVGDVAQGVYLGVAQGCIIKSQLSGTPHGVGSYDTDILFSPGVGEFGNTFLSTETWYNVPLTGGSGSGAIANITVGSGGGVTAVELFIGTTFENPVGGCCGAGYVGGVSPAGDNLSATPSAPFWTNEFTWGGFSNSTGSGFQVHIDAVATNTIGTNPIDAAGYPFPNRTIETYDSDLLLGPGTFANFIALAKANCKFNWDTRYTADAVNNYIRAGFATGGTPLNITPLRIRLHA